MLQKIVYLLVILLGILVISGMVVASEPYDTTTYSKIKNGLYSLYSKNLISSDEYELKRKAYYSDIFESNTFGPDRALTNYLEYEKQYLQLETNNQKNIIYARVKDGLYSLFRSSLITRDEYELTRKAYYSDIFESNTFGPDRALANYLEYEKNISEKIIKTPINTPNIQISPNNRFYTRVKAQYEVKLGSMNEDSLNTLLIKAQNQLKKYRKGSIAETKLQALIFIIQAEREKRESELDLNIFF